MNLFEEEVDWTSNLKQLIDKYGGRKHPLNYQNLYQLIIMVILSAKDSDENINKLAPIFFETYPSFESITNSSPQSIIPFISKIENFKNKANWIFETAKQITTNKEIPLNLNKLTSLKGIGRKSANTILREMKIPAQGIIVDLHVIRVAPRIGLTPSYEDGNKIEKELISIFPKQIWNEIGMSISFLGRELCRSQNPKCNLCPINNHCNYYKSKYQ